MSIVVKKFQRDSYLRLRECNFSKLEVTPEYDLPVFIYENKSIGYTRVQNIANKQEDLSHDKAFESPIKMAQ